MAKTIYSHGRTKNGRTVEWWHVLKDGTWNCVEITFDATWFSQEGSIEDLKRLAVATFGEKEHHDSEI